MIDAHYVYVKKASDLLNEIAFSVNKNLSTFKSRRDGMKLALFIYMRLDEFYYLDKSVLLFMMVKLILISRN